VLRKISLILSPQLVLKNVLELVYINTQGHHKKE
jgi:hypothetical protein